MVLISDAQLGLLQVSIAEVLMFFIAWGIVAGAAGAALTWLALRDRRTATPPPAPEPAEPPAAVTVTRLPVPAVLPSTRRIVPVIPGRRPEDRTTASIPRIDPQATVVFEPGRVPR